MRIFKVMNKPGRTIGRIRISRREFLAQATAVAATTMVPRRMEAYTKPPKNLPRSSGHYEEWIAASRGGPPTDSKFLDHSGLLTQVCLLGNIAVRAQKKLEWDQQSRKRTFASRIPHRLVFLRQDQPEENVGLRFRK